MQAGRGIEAVREHEREQQLYIDGGVLTVPRKAECQRSRARGRQNRTAWCRIIPIMLNRIARLGNFCAIDREIAKKGMAMPAEQPAAVVAALSMYGSVFDCD